MAVAIVAALVATVAASSCSKGDDGAKQLSKAGGATSDGPADSGTKAARAELVSGPAVGQQVQADRDVIYTGRLHVRVGDVEKAAERARRLADDAGGYLAKSDAKLDDTQEITVTVRVPSTDFEQVVSNLADLGKVQSRSVDSEDVTDQVVDLEGRLENARTSAARPRELLAKAENVQNVITIEDRLTQRESEIEAISGQLEVVQDQVDLASIRVTLTEKDSPSVSRDLPGPLEALRSGAVAFVNVAIAVVAVLAFLLPFAPLVALAWWLRRRWRRARPKHDAPTWPAAGPPPPRPAPVGAPAAPAPPAPPAPGPIAGPAAD